MAKMLVKISVTQHIYVDPRAYGMRDDIADLDEMATVDQDLLEDKEVIVGDFFNPNDETFKLTYEEVE